MSVPTAPDLPGLTVIQKAARLVSLTFVLVGVLGFIPGVTQNVDSMTFASHHSNALLLGVFQVSILHNLVHVLFGVAGWLASRSIGTARSYLLVGGAVYLVLFVYGLAIPATSRWNFMPVNAVDNVLHVLLGLGLLALGSIRTRRSDPTSL